MRLKVIACKVLTRELSALCAGSENYIDFTWLRQGYHNEPDLLRKILQQEIDKIDNDDDPFTCSSSVGEFDAIVLGYGLCSNGVCGVKSKKYPIVIPRAHDCITLFLGSKERYRELFDEQDGGIYWYTPGWIENSIMPSKKQYEINRQIYAENYGEENADYLMEMEQGWLKKYHWAYYVSLNGVKYPDYREFTKSCADYHGWSFKDIDGDDNLLKALIDGNWDSDKFIVIPPDKCAAPSYDDNILCEKDSFDANL